MHNLLVRSTLDVAAAALLNGWPMWFGLTQVATVNGVSIYRTHISATADEGLLRLTHKSMTQLSAMIRDWGEAQMPGKRPPTPMPRVATGQATATSPLEPLRQAEVKASSTLPLRNRLSDQAKKMTAKRKNLIRTRLPSLRLPSLHLQMDYLLM